MRESVPFCDHLEVNLGASWMPYFEASRLVRFLGASRRTRIPGIMAGLVEMQAAHVHPFLPVRVCFLCDTLMSHSEVGVR
jgi:hypothetical protein